MLDRRRALMLLVGSGLALACGRAGAQLDAPAQDSRGEWSMDPNPALPNVLILGDSISMGYTLDVRRLLQGQANVMHPMQANGLAPVNCGNTAFGLAHLASWLANTKWDVIHFNWGLHDLAYYRQVPSPSTGDSKAHLVGAPIMGKLPGTQAILLPEYKKNLTRLVEKMERTRASLIWAATTAVPPGSSGRIPEDVVKYNQAAARIMRARGVKIDDLYALTKSMPLDMHPKPNNVHYKKEGYEEIARQVASSVKASLQQVRRPA